MADISKVKLPDNVTYNLKDSGAVRKTGDTMTGNLILYREGTTTQNYPTQLFFQNKDTTTGKTSQGTIKGYDGGEYGLNMVINPAGNLFIGSGEAADNHYGLYPHNTGENFYATADGNMYLQANGQTIANRVGIVIDTSHNIMPSKADTATNNIGSIGTSSYKWANGYFTNINGVAVGNSPKFTDNNTTYNFNSSTSTVSIGISTTDPAAFSVDLTLTKDNVTTALGYTPPTANTDVNVKVNNTNPASGTWYYPVWYTATSGTGNVNANDGLRYYSLQGTASAAGRSILSLGNNTSTGTAGNKRGELFLYSEKSGRAEIVYTAAATATVVHTFPATAGTILNTGTTSFTQSLSSGTKIGTIKINGTSTDLYCQTNTNTHRPIQVNGTEILGNNTTALNLKAGSNVSVTNSSGTVTIAATDAKVTQTNTTDNGLYRVLFSESINDTTETEGARKSTKLRFNPSTGQLTLTSLYASGGITAGDGLELGMGSDSTVPFIDFHWQSTDTDYTARLIQRAENTIDFMGKNSGTWGTARAASFSSQSSIFVKENIYSITDDEAKKLLQLRPVIFDYKGDGLKNQRGLIAEEVMDVMPEMVIIPQGYKEYDPIEPWNTPCIDYSKFVPYLIKMVQIQQKEIDELKARI